MKSPNRLPVGTNPRGKPIGSNGAARKIPKWVDKKVKVKFRISEIKQLKNIHGEKLRIETVKLYLWNLPKIKMIVTQFNVERAYIGKKLVAQAVHPELPKRGIFGNELVSYAIALKNGFSGSYEKIAEHIEDLTGESFSAQTIKDCVHRTGNELEPSYRELESELRSSDIVGSDETGWRVNGLNWFLWLLCTIKIVYIAIENSRARKEIIRILGIDFEGIVVSDCLAVYLHFAKEFQKCWAHLLRATHTLAEINPKKDIVLLHEWLSNLFNEVSNFLKKNPTAIQREKMFNVFDCKLEDIINYKWKSNEAECIVKNRLVKFRNHWLTAVLFEGVPLTNNDTERNIRSSIPTRKLLGGHRTKEGAKYYAITQSLRLTWKLRGLSPYSEMIQKLREINRNQAL